MQSLIIKVGDHRRRLQALVQETRGIMRVASPYVSDRGLLLGTNIGDVRLLTTLRVMDIVSGATSLGVLRALVRGGVKCRFLEGAPRLHGKLYILGDERALVTSANLTKSAFDSNIEIGVLVDDGKVRELTRWFDKKWVVEATRLDEKWISYFEEKSASLRRDYSRLQERVRARESEVRPTPVTCVGSSCRFFLCNTDRKHSDQTAGEFRLEELMKDKRYATAWEDFDYPAHMEQVKRDDIILMYANRAGIIAVGRVKGDCEVLRRGSPGRVVDDFQSTEWRVPIKEWLWWVKDERACSWEPTSPKTFLNVSGESYSSRLKDVMKYFALTKGTN